MSLKSQTMRAVVLDQSQLCFQSDHVVTPRAGMIEVDVIQAGICETDLQLVRGYMDFSGVLGHEFVGVARSGKYQGQRVAGEINCACGVCEECRRGLPNHCPRRTVLGILNHDGAFADRLWLPEENLHPIPERVTNDQAVFVEPLAAAFQIATQLDIEQFSRTVVLGDGRLGYLCAQVINQFDTSLLVVGKHREKLNLFAALEIETMLLDECGERQFADLVIDCTGSPRGMTTAFDIIRPRGTIVLKSTFAGHENPNLAPAVIDELTIIGSRCGPFDQAIAALAENRIDVQSLITARYPLEQVSEAFVTAQRSDQFKVLLEMGSGPTA